MLAESQVFAQCTDTLTVRGDVPTEGVVCAWPDAVWLVVCGRGLAAFVM